MRIETIGNKHIMLWPLPSGGHSPVFDGKTGKPIEFDGTEVLAHMQGRPNRIKKIRDAIIMLEAKPAENPNWEGFSSFNGGGGNPIWRRSPGAGNR